jgi:hypothetical protein
MAFVTAYLGRRSIARSLAPPARAASAAWSMLLGAHRVFRVSLEAVGEAQDMRRELVRKYPFSDI